MSDDDVKRLLEVCQKCDAFFKEALDEAIKNQRVQISEDVASYLLWILLMGIRKDPHFNPQTTIQRYVNAFTGQGPETFRDIGDSSLMMAGIWPDSLTRKLVNIDYYLKMGSLAYQREAETSQNLGDLFEELSENFTKSANILMEVTQFISANDPKPNDILKIYERWLKTHNKFLERILIKLGINPVKVRTHKQ